MDTSVRTAHVPLELADRVDERKADGALPRLDRQAGTRRLGTLGGREEPNDLILRVFHPCEDR